MAATPSYAQTTTPVWDLSGSYSFLRDQDLDESLHGWLASGAFNLTPVFAIAAEVGGNAKGLDIVNVDLGVFAFMVGPRIYSRDAERVTFYGQLMLGAVRRSYEIFDESESETDFSLQPGAGLDFWVQPNMGLRVGVDYRQIFQEGEDGGQFRFTVGVVVQGGN
jgi:opacity protein-like surface antigen